MIPRSKLPLTGLPPVVTPITVTAGSYVVLAESSDIEARYELHTHICRNVECPVSYKRRSYMGGCFYLPDSIWIFHDAAALFGRTATGISARGTLAAGCQLGEINAIV